jgi:1-acyl-sn-glycerol-3-phosphate acyltransferase
LLRRRYNRLGPAHGPIQGYIDRTEKRVTVPPDRLAALGLKKDYVLLAMSLALGVFFASLMALGTDSVTPEELLWYPLGGFAVGGILALAQRHPYRSLGLVPFASVGFTLGLLWTACQPDNLVAWVVLGLASGLGAVPLISVLWPSEDARVSAGMLTGFFTILLLGLGLGLGFVVGGKAAISPLLILALVAALLTALAWWQLLRPAIEQFTEFIVAPMYRIRGYGPGIAAFPQSGPVLVICNHTAWIDPLWLGKVIPRRLKPMMTSDFYDKPAIRWLMRDVVRAIRVQTSRFRREAPELAEGVAALDAGECLVLFPEGHLRRTDQATMRNFGRGVWHILHDRPMTPVVACWIEGGWGSYTSYFQGKPTVNKRPDFWRKIQVAMAEPMVIDPAILADVRATRRYLMEQCVAARGLLGLEVPTLDEPEEEEKE